MNPITILLAVYKINTFKTSTMIIVEIKLFVFSSDLF